MNEYLVKVRFTLDDTNYWIDHDFTREIEAENLEQAYSDVVEIIKEDCFMTVSANAIRNRQIIYVDDKNGVAKQVGYVYRIHTEIDNGTRLVTKLGHAWVTIKQLIEC